LSLASPPLEKLAGAERAYDLGQIGNDSMTELCQKYPERFPAFIATVPMENEEWMMKETKRCIEDIGASAIQIFTNYSGKPLDL
uniref:amidohydrolase family protein n=1 Tax=Stenotrophomonas sp. GbtcB23 TaxID=2824768 RepID=UPI001C3078A8